MQCIIMEKHSNQIKTCVKRPLSKRTQIGFQYQLSLNAGQKYCRMLPLDLSLRSLFGLFLSGRFTHVLLYNVMSFMEDRMAE